MSGHLSLILSDQSDSINVKGQGNVLGDVQVVQISLGSIMTDGESVKRAWKQTCK